jgi:hypothetical protein
MAEAFGVVHVLVSGEAAKHGLPKHSDQRMPPVLARPRVSELLARHRAQAERIVKFTVGEQASVRCND